MLHVSLALIAVHDNESPAGEYQGAAQLDGSGNPFSMFQIPSWLDPDRDPLPRRHPESSSAEWAIYS